MRPRTVIAGACALGIFAAGPSAAPAQPAAAPTPGALYQDGPDGRYLLGGEWLFRLDDSDIGLRARYQADTETARWTPVQVPHAWNAGDFSDLSMRGSVGWYRKDFLVPDDPDALSWALRFESVNYRARVWLNGREIGRHEGAYLPFELAARGLRRDSVNRLVVRVDSRRGPFDLPPGGFEPDGDAEGGWWNYGGIVREVYLRRVSAADFADVLVRPNLPCARCDASVRVAARVRNTSRERRTLSVRGTLGGAPLAFGGGREVEPGSSATFTARVRVADPQLWSPASPRLYRVSLRASSGGAATPRYTVHTGIRSIRLTRDGRMLLNGRPVSLRGASMHEDDPTRGSALTPERRRRDVDLLRELGATMTRAHYPLHPYTLELLDRNGILLWNQAPVYQLRGAQLTSASVRAKAVRFVEGQVLRDRNHPSVLAWSVANELPARPDAGQEKLIAATTRAVRRLDRTRLVAMDILGYPSVGVQDAYRTLDALGINDYFGWYPGPNGSIYSREDLPGYLDELHAYYPRQALFVTEFGAEANRDGPIDERGTYEFQRDFLRYHLSVFAQKPFVNGALVWLLRDFRVKPGWDGGNPKPEPPVNFKGLVSERGVPKPAFEEVARLFRGTRQLR